MSQTLKFFVSTHIFFYYSVFIFSLLIFLGVNTGFAAVAIGDFISSGHIMAIYYPPHNEYDPNPGIPFSYRYVARYGLDIYTTLSCINFLPKLYIFADMFSLFGNSRPQISYNYSAKPIVMWLTGGIGYHFTRHLAVGIVSSEHVGLSNNYTLGEVLPWSGVYAAWTW